MELGELNALTRSEQTALKGFITRRHDEFRRPFERKILPHSRRFVLAGTIHRPAYLVDDTGARRFWPVKVESIDLDKVQRDREQLWAEAIHRYRQGDKWYLHESDLGENGAGVRHPDG